MTGRTHQTRESATNADLQFCSNCHVSIAQVELENRTAHRTPSGKMWCTLCTRAGIDGRRRRRAVLEEEFADDAPIIEPGGDEPAVETAPVQYGPTVEQRVGHLERTVFQLQNRVQELEERLRET